MSSDTMRVVLADHQVLFRQSLAKILAEAGWIVVAEITTGENLQQQLSDLQPALLVIDYTLPGIDVLEFCLMYTQHMPEIRVVLVAGYEHQAQELQVEAFQAGIAACLSKDHSGDIYLDTLRFVMRGFMIFNHAVLQAAYAESVATLSDSLPTTLATSLSAPDVVGTPLAALTKRELETLQLIATGLPNPQIAKQLQISTNTVMKHASNLMDKLDVSNRMEAAMLYLNTIRNSTP